MLYFLFSENNLMQKFKRPGISGLAWSLLFFVIWGCGNGQPNQETAKKSNPAIFPADQDSSRNIVFLGNSITSGFGVGESDAFPSLIQEKIDSLKLPYHVINAGISGETSADGLSRIHWVLKQPVSILVLELGGNDGLRGIPLTGTTSNLQAIMDSARKKNPSVILILAGMQIPPNLGQQYTGEFRKIYHQLAIKNHTLLIPFLLENVGGIPALNQPDGIHPNVEGHKIVAENVWKILGPVLHP